VLADGLLVGGELDDPDRLPGISRQALTRLIGANTA
jgi:hypothetical protein